MVQLILILLIISCIAALFDLFSTRKGEKEESIRLANGSCAACDGTDEKCEQECMMEASVKEIEYFDDEELDAFRGKAADQYTDEEVKAFAEVLYTMQQNEVKDWNRSLILRGINLPDQLKDEVIMMIADN